MIRDVVLGDIPFWCRPGPVLRFKKGTVKIDVKDDKIRLVDKNPVFKDMFILGDNLDEVLKELREDISFIWETYAEEDDAKMDEGAINLKRDLHDNFEISYGQ